MRTGHPKESMSIVAKKSAYAFSSSTITIVFWEVLTLELPLCAV
jgi:hypothetical protein